MSDWPPEAEILTANLMDEIVAQLGPLPVTLERLKTAVEAAFPEAYMATLRDCMSVTADKATNTVQVHLPPWLMTES